MVDYPSQSQFDRAPEARVPMAKKAVAPQKTNRPQPVVTARQREVFDFLRERIVARGYGPTVREIAQHFGMTSPNAVTCHLKALEKKGLITREAYMSRAIQLTETPEPQAALPLVGQLAPGKPLELLPEPHARLEFVGLFASAVHCCLRVIGRELLSEAIAEGDYLVVRRQTDCRDGELVVVTVDGTLTTVRRYYRETRRIRLESTDRSRPPEFATQVAIIGLLVGVIRQY